MLSHGRPGGVPHLLEGQSGHHLLHINHRLFVLAAELLQPPSGPLKDIYIVLQTNT